MRLPSAIEPITIASQAYNHIKASILSAEFDPGQRLSDIELATRLQVSRSPIREAIHKLAHEGLVEIIPHKGAFVVQLTQRQTEELFDIRASLEGLACRLACQHVSEAEIASARRTLQQARRRLENGTIKEYPQGDIDFHMIIARWGKNQELQVLLEVVHRKIFLVRYRSGAAVARANEAIAEHLAILDAIKSRDPKKAEESMRAHTQKACANILHFLTSLQEPLP